MFSHQKKFYRLKIPIFRISEQQKGQGTQVTKYKPAANRQPLYQHMGSADIHPDVTSQLQQNVQ